MDNSRINAEQRGKSELQYFLKQHKKKYLQAKENFLHCQSTFSDSLRDNLPAELAQYIESLEQMHQKSEQLLHAYEQYGVCLEQHLPQSSKSAVPAKRTPNSTNERFSSMNSRLKDALRE